jgi:hypothetical protein
MRTKYGQGVWAVTRAYALQQTDWFSARDVQRILFDNAKIIEGESTISLISRTLSDLVANNKLQRSDSKLRAANDRRAYVKYKTINATQDS